MLELTSLGVLSCVELARTATSELTLTLNDMLKLINFVKARTTKLKPGSFVGDLYAEHI